MSKYLDPILTALSSGPKTNEDLRRHLAKSAVFASSDTIRKVCVSAWEQKRIEKRMVVTKKHRMGIAVWSLPEESAEKIAAVEKCLLEEPYSSFKFGR